MNRTIPVNLYVILMFIFPGAYMISYSDDSELISAGYFAITVGITLKYIINRMNKDEEFLDFISRII